MAEYTKQSRLANDGVHTQWRVLDEAGNVVTRGQAYAGQDLDELARYALTVNQLEPADLPEAWTAWE
ncbi:hypothetical protein [Oryzihumus sp.]|jgi:hypothetical protein|uniref:hypothetical protein n=1 Tax=Oryzihumus sp. TaxID=1968903 RepID=UPI002ED9ED40